MERGCGRLPIPLWTFEQLDQLCSPSSLAQGTSSDSIIEKVLSPRKCPDKYQLACSWYHVGAANAWHHVNVKAGSQYDAKQRVALRRLHVDTCWNATWREERERGSGEWTYMYIRLSPGPVYEIPMKFQQAVKWHDNNCNRLSLVCTNLCTPYTLKFNIITAFMYVWPSFPGTSKTQVRMCSHFQDDLTRCRTLPERAVNTRILWL